MTTPIHPAPKKHKKSLEIETLRGIACILLVSYHVIGDSPNSGLRVEDETFWRYFNELLAYIRMPLFAFISGYVYALYTIKRDDFPKFYINKLRRLGMPLLSASLMFMVISNIVNTAYSRPWLEFYNIYVFSYAHFWYLQASLLIFLVIAILGYLNLFKTKASLYLLLAISIMANALPLSEINVFSFNGFVYIFPFFITGMMVKRFDLPLAKYKHAIIGISLLLMSALILLYNNSASLSFSIERNTVPMILISMFFCIALLAGAFKNKLLAWIGGYSYAIYLFHFAQSGMRIGMEKFELDVSNSLTFLVCLITGLMIPIFMELVFRQNKYLNFVFLGNRLFRKK